MVYGDRDLLRSGMRNTGDTQPTHLKIGTLGEDIGCRFLEERGFTIIDRNYRKKWGEIDIVAKKINEIRFIEVKSVSCEILKGGVIRETYLDPESAIHLWKQKRLKRAIQSYILEHNLQNTDWQFDILGVFVDTKNKIAKVRFTENMVL